MERCHRIAGWLLPVLALAACGGGGSSHPARFAFAFPLDAPPATAMTAVRAFPQLSFLRPLFVTAPPDGSDRIFVVDQVGRIFVFRNDDAATQAREFLDLRPKVTAVGGEMGLLGLAFDPDYAHNGTFYVDYTRDGPLETVVAAYRVTADADVADPASERILLTVAQPFQNHNGGMLAFGPDDLLYVALGDGGSGGDPFGHGQDRTTLLGSLLRIDPHGGSGGAAYGVPADNPFVGEGSGVRPEIWAYGLRNPWRFSFDRQTGELWLGDVGQGAREEIDLVTAGANLGWNLFEGNLPFRNPPAPASAFTAPVLDYGRVLGSSVIGGYVYRGARTPELRGSYVYGDYVSGNLWALQRDGGAVQNRLLATVAHPSSFGEDQHGELLVVSHDGALFRLQPSGPGGASFPRTLSATGLFTELATLTPAAGLVEYEVNAPFWSDGAHKRRWLAAPLEPFTYDDQQPWTLPVGTVLVKHFELELVVGDPGSRRRLETRVLVHEAAGWAGYCYRWDEAGTDAVLLGGRDEATFTIADAAAPGGQRTQRWTFPSRTDCRQCHTAAAGVALGIRTHQLEREVGGENQIDRLRLVGVLQGPEMLPRVAWPLLDDGAVPVAERARAWLQVNCAHCHGPGGTAPSAFDLRFATATAAMGVVDVRPAHGDLGLADPWLVRPRDRQSSVLWLRAARRDGTAMPPLGSHEVDPLGVDLVGRWIDSLP